MIKELLIVIGVIISFINCTTAENPKDKTTQLSSDSLYIIGENILNEDTDTPNYDKAEYYLSEAAKLNYPRAFYTLGYEYTLGHKLQRNKEKGVEYLKKAAELGVKEAFYYLAQFYFNQGDVENAKIMLEKGSEEGDYYATYQLHMIYYEGYAFGQSEKKNGALIDLKRGFEYLLKSAELGSFEAQLSLAYLYTNGKQGLLKPDREIALYYFELAQNNSSVLEIPGASDEIEAAKKDLGF